MNAKNENSLVKFGKGPSAEAPKRPELIGIPSKDIPARFEHAGYEVRVLAVDRWSVCRGTEDQMEIRRVGREMQLSVGTVCERPAYLPVSNILRSMGFNVCSCITRQIAKEQAAVADETKFAPVLAKRGIRVLCTGLGRYRLTMRSDRNGFGFEHDAVDACVVGDRVELSFGLLKKEGTMELVTCILREANFRTEVESRQNAKLRKAWAAKALRDADRTPPNTSTPIDRFLERFGGRNRLATA